MRFSLLLAAALLAGCSAPGTQLEPAPAATTTSAETAVDRVSGVRMTVQSGAWPGLARVKTQVSPLRVVIQNDSSMPLRLRYNEFALVSPSGTRYSALPPYGVEGDVTKPTLADTYDPVTTPAFRSNGFRVAPYYASVYPSMTAYSGRFDYDRPYYDRYSRTYRNIELPTQEMVSRVLPEGVIDPGGSVEGYLYFERVPAGTPRVRFRADLTDAESGNSFGEISIPFTVEG